MVHPENLAKYEIFRMLLKYHFLLVSFFSQSLSLVSLIFAVFRLSRKTRSVLNIRYSILKRSSQHRQIDVIVDRLVMLREMVFVFKFSSADFARESWLDTAFHALV